MKNFKNSIYGAITPLATPILMLLTIPVFLNYLGVENYAIWILVNTVISSLAIFNFGGSDIVIKFISSNRGGGNNSTGEIFSTVFIFQVFISLFIYIIFLIIAPLAIKYFTSSNSYIFVNVLYLAIPIFFVRQSEELLYAFLRGHEQFGYVAFISTISKVLFFLTQVVIAIWTESVLDVFYGALLISMLLFLAQALYIKVLHKNGISFSQANAKTAKSLLNFGGWNWLSSLTSILKAHSDKWLVSWLLGLQIFGLYSIGVLVFNQLYNILSSSLYWIFPEISKNGSNKKYLARNYWKLLSLVTIVSLIISISLVNLDILFKLWLGKEFYEGSQYYISTFLLLFPVFTLNIVSYFYLLGLGLVKQKFFADITSLLVKVCTIYLVIIIFDIEEWILFFMVFIIIEFIAYAIIISRSLPIQLISLILFALAQVVIVIVRS